MTPDEHQRERMTRWTRAFDTCATDGSGTDHCGAYADNALNTATRAAARKRRAKP